MKKIIYGESFLIFLRPRHFGKSLFYPDNLPIDRDIKTIVRELALGNRTLLQEKLNRTIKTFSNRDHYGFTEKHFHVITLSLLSFAEFYFIDSQPELDNKYPDILLIGRDEKVPNNYLFELKWLKQKDDYVNAIPKLRSFLLIGSKDGVEFLEV